MQPDANGQVMASISPRNRRISLQFNNNLPVRLKARFQAKHSTLDHHQTIRLTNLTRSMMDGSRSVKRTLCMLTTSAIIAILLKSTSLNCDTSNQPPTLAKMNQRTSQGALPSEASQRERLLSSLAESIERKHFGSSPTRAHAFVNSQKPHKMDTTGDTYKLPAGFDTSSKYRAPTRTKTDDSMQNILMMHELAARPPLVSVKQRPAEQDRPKVTQDKRIINQLVSYVSPLVGSKMLQSSALGQKMSLASNVTDTRQKLHQFVARSNNGPAALVNMKLVSELGKRLIAVGPVGRRQPATKAPQTSFLVKPASGQLDGSSHQFNPTPPSFSFESSPSSASLSDIESSLDLLTADTLGSSSVSSNRDPAGLGSPANEAPKSSTSKEKLTSQNNAGSWLSNGANQLAQSYLQDSLRGLLTMSQLPILSANPISTAPSVYERAGKRKLAASSSGSNKPVASQTSSISSQTQSMRLRAIDELYRYAYIIGSGVRRKRDPLKALSSASSPASSALSNRRKGFLGQRSNGLTSDGLNMASTALKTLLAGGPSSSKKAKPRGIMWDMATDPTLAVTVFHLLERASVALPLGKFQSSIYFLS